MTPEEIEQAKKDGAEVKVLPKEVTVNGLPDLVQQLDKMLETNRKGQAVMLAAIQQLTQVIQNKQMTSDTDLSELVEAVKGLQHKTESSYAPVEWELIFERDNRNMLKSGMRFRPVTVTLN